MGRPLRKLHQTHFRFFVPPDMGNIRATIQVPHPSVPHQGGTGFVSKKDRLEKADRQPARERPDACWYLDTVFTKPR